jgi:hypothetical protein
MSLHFNRTHTARITHTSGANYLGLAALAAAEREATHAALAAAAKKAEVMALVEVAMNCNRYASVSFGPKPTMRMDCHKAKPVIVTRLHAGSRRRFTVDFIYC